MSGYAQPILASHGADAPEMNILEKPFTEATLLTRIHEALRQAQHAAGLRPDVAAVALQRSRPQRWRRAILGTCALIRRSR